MEMRTRRSWRNQDRLYKALQGVIAENLGATKPISNCCWDCVSFANAGRIRGTCSMIGAYVRGDNVDRPCFMARKERK